MPSVGLDADGNGEVFRMNLDLGQFLNSYKIDVGRDEGVETGLQGSIYAPSVNCGAIAEYTHGLTAFGTSAGTVAFFDPRSKKAISVTGPQMEGEVTALDFSNSGLSLAVGSSEGIVNLFDLRSPRALLQKDQGMGYSIKQLMHLTTASQEKKILSADKRTIKIWDESDGKPWASMEPVVDINHVAWVKDTGMLMTANEGKLVVHIFHSDEPWTNH